MNDAIAIQGKLAGPSTMLHTFALAFAALTLVFALLSLILGNRLLTLRTHILTAEKEALTSEAATIQGLETKLKTAIDNFDATKKKLEEEKAATERLNRQLAAVMKDYEKAKSDLSSANQKISELKSTIPAQLRQITSIPEQNTNPIVAPSTGTVLSQDPLPQAVPEQNKPSMVLSAPVQSPATAAPETSTAQTPPVPAVTPEKRVGTPGLPTSAPLSPDSTSPATQETLTGSPKAPPPTAAPTGD